MATHHRGTMRVGVFTAFGSIPAGAPVKIRARNDGLVDVESQDNGLEALAVATWKVADDGLEYWEEDRR